MCVHLSLPLPLSVCLCVHTHPTLPNAFPRVSLLGYKAETKKKGGEEEDTRLLLASFLLRFCFSPHHAEILTISLPRARKLSLPRTRAVSPPLSVSLFLPLYVPITVSLPRPSLLSAPQTRTKKMKSGFLDARRSVHALIPGLTISKYIADVLQLTTGPIRGISLCRIYVRSQ